VLDATVSQLQVGCNKGEGVPDRLRGQANVEHRGGIFATLGARAHGPDRQGELMNDGHLEFCASPQWRAMLAESILPTALEGIDLGDRVLEIGPGPGLTTDLLREHVAHLTVVELDEDLATALERRLEGTNVTVLTGDATSLALASESFTGAVSFHMLHHVPTAEAQDAAFRELARVLEPGGWLTAADGVENEGSRTFHEGDVYNPIDPDELGGRLRAAGFRSAEITLGELGWFATAQR
jgi:SAM-dependent methyltransferase